MSATSSDPDTQLFGWELLCNSVRSDLTTNADILLCFTHLVLVRQGFKCIGLGDSIVLQGDEPKTESLPAGWKDTQSLRYVFRGKLYNLKATRVDDGIMLNLVRPDERNVSMVHLEDKFVVNKNISIVEDMVPEYKSLVKMINDELIEKVTLSQNTREQPSQTDPLSSSSHPIHTGHYPMLHDRSPTFPMNPVGPALVDPFNGVRDIGRDDLHPSFGGGLLGGPGRLGGGVPDLGIGGGGGMLFVPPRGGGVGGPLGPGNFGGVPGGSVPPGARFDPFRAPDPDRFPRPPRRPNAPDNDEFNPPGWDDMYM